MSARRRRQPRADSRDKRNGTRPPFPILFLFLFFLFFLVAAFYWTRLDSSKSEMRRSTCALGGPRDCDAEREQKAGREPTSGRNRPDILRNRVPLPPTLSSSQSSFPDFFYLHGGIAFPPIVPAWMLLSHSRIPEPVALAISHAVIRRAILPPPSRHTSPSGDRRRDGGVNDEDVERHCGRNWRLARLFRACIRFLPPRFPSPIRYAAQ